eukprot:gene20361-biopygen14625
MGNAAPQALLGTYGTLYTGTVQWHRSLVIAPLNKFRGGRWQPTDAGEARAPSFSLRWSFSPPRRRAKRCAAPF